MRHGFRELTKIEIDAYARAVDDKDISQNLMFAGISPETGEMTGSKKYSLPSDAFKKLSHIPFKEKLALIKQLSRLEHGSDSGVEWNRTMRRQRIEQHLIQAE